MDGLRRRAPSSSAPGRTRRAIEPPPSVGRLGLSVRPRTDRIGRGRAGALALRVPSSVVPAAPGPPQSGVAGSQKFGIPAEDGRLLLLPLRRPGASALPEPRQERGALPQRRHAGGRWCRRRHLQGNRTRPDASVRRLPTRLLTLPRFPDPAPPAAALIGVSTHATSSHQQWDGVCG